MNDETKPTPTVRKPDGEVTFGGVVYEKFRVLPEGAELVGAKKLMELASQIAEEIGALTTEDDAQFIKDNWSDPLSSTTFLFPDWLFREPYCTAAYFYGVQGECFTAFLHPTTKKWGKSAHLLRRKAKVED